ncbi:hypothetical protein [Vibrio owensii]|uniref:hypothetical protein n=1 Tax=Vibrio owensii TaxID=696485 RepID=UPI00148D6E40|nr:hypothetical protein [Vibrio owensii]NOI69607.1 hypothetical protein [Vibrio owensii]
MSRVDSFRKLQAQRVALERTAPRAAADAELIEKMLGSDVDNRRLSSLDYSCELAHSIDINSGEAKQLLAELQTRFTSDKVEALLSEVKRDVIQSIAVPFGLGKVVAAYDKLGGNVTTIHNAQQNIYAKDSDKYNRHDYTVAKNSQGESFERGGQNAVGARFTRNQMDSDGNITDAYTGKLLKAEQTSPDHSKSLSSYHKDGGFMQSTVKKADFATDERNLASTQRNINASLKDDDKIEWVEKKQGGREETNEVAFDIDRERFDEVYERGNKAAVEHLPNKKEQVTYFAKNITLTGVHEGAKMGAQQGFGVLLVELLTQIMEEIQDIFKNGKAVDSWISDIKSRLKKIGNKVASKWKAALEGFASGGITGFVSNFVTVMINRFVTTCTRMVRLIREGVFSLFKAAKTLLFRPEGITYRMAAHEASKLVMAGVVVAGGVLLEEVIDGLVSSIPFLVPISTVVTSVLVGSITGIAMAMSAYIIDRLDLLRIVEVDQHNYVIKALDNNIQENLERSEEIATNIDKYLLA